MLRSLDTMRIETRRISAAMWVMAACVLVSGSGCPGRRGGGGGGAGGGNGPGGNTNDNTNVNDNRPDGGPGSGIASFRIIGTSAFVDPVGEVKAGDDIIAIGTGQGSGVQYLIPSRGDTEPLNISNTATLLTAGFGVAGNWILARNFDGRVGAFNGETEEATALAESELALFSGDAVAGFPEFEGDGEFVVTLADPAKVADGRTVKLIDLSGGAPEVISFLDPPVEPVVGRESERWLVAIDATAGQFLVQVTDFLVLYDIDAPEAEPQVLELTAEGGVSNIQKVHLDQGRVIYLAQQQTDDGRRLTRLADFNDGSSVLLGENPSRTEWMDLESGEFGYFADETDDDLGTNNTARSVFGSIGVAGPAFNILNEGREPIGSDPDDGIVGFGCNVAITPDGRFRFISGCGTVAIAEYLQASDGGEFEVLPDQLDIDPFGLGTPASKVSASNTLAAFELGDGSVGYIELP